MDILSVLVFVGVVAVLVYLAFFMTTKSGKVWKK